MTQEHKEFLKYAKDSRLEVVFEQVNPKNVGSASWERYELYKKSKTLAEVVPLGGKSEEWTILACCDSICLYKRQVSQLISPMTIRVDTSDFLKEENSLVSVKVALLLATTASTL